MSEAPAIVSQREMCSQVIEFNRAELRNPLSVGVLKELSALIDDIEVENRVKTVIFTGVKDVFASGADLNEIAAITAPDAAEFAMLGQRLMSRIASLRMETIAAVNGYCFGGGLDLALACGRRIASPNAVFAHPGASLGIMTGWGGTQRLPRLIGESRALEMFFTARRVSANEGLKMGLVDFIAKDPLATALGDASRDDR